MLQVSAGTGNVDFQADVGTTQALESLTVISSTTTDLQNVDTRDGGIAYRSDEIEVNEQVERLKDHPGGDRARHL